VVQQFRIDAASAEVARCDREISSLAQLAESGHTDLDGITMALRDWRTERSLIQQEQYRAFLKQKQFSLPAAGFAVGSVNPKLFDFQRDVTKWALKKGKAALFEDCGLGKTLQELEWSAQVFHRTGKPVINFAPLAVSRQTQREGVKFNIPVTVCREQADVKPGVNIANYEMLKNFDAREFSGIVIDESSILKGDGPMRRDITTFAHHIPYRLAATATPAPNDYMELGNHLEFLGVMSKSEMLSTFFVHDGEDTQKWRLKGHAEKAFWQCIAHSAVMIRKPSDLGYPDGDFKLPPIEYHQHTVAAEWSSDYLFPVEAKTLQERQGARRDSLEARVKLCAELVNASPERWICWCNLNDESEALAASILRAVEVTGSQKDEFKEQALLDFAEGNIDRLVTKGKIAGFGMNFQACSHMALVGLSDSWELLYQLVRRCWRFGQKRTVHVHVITGELEGAVVRNIERKERQASQMAEAMLGHMKEINTAEIHGTIREQESYNGKAKVKQPAWL
jgi:superfamily II DNA or RNA helicase